MRHIDLILRVSSLLLLGHSLGEIGDLEVSCATSRHDQCRLSSEEALACCALGADGWIDSPFVILSVLDGNLLGGRLSNDS